ncbi:hypothetical protein LTR36_007407 [Oleoguttula mirabilis]|uniref:Glycosyl transferase CAP10 domain-containing protein n=1 Tax=Oleoguttula mirabilis TaxID=1507867 RepID=A0AAV9J9U7_9PEZI|nr:hypothetical protein LTR36_007407 [Oleoguttula mirabilis]
MPSLLSRYQHDASAARTHLALPLLLLLPCILAYIGTPNKHSLLTSAVAWLSICIYTTLKIGARSLLDAAPAQRLAWAAGALFAVAQVEERAVEGRGIWWAKAFLPLVVYAIGHTSIVPPSDASNHADSSTGSDKQRVTPTYKSTTPLYILSASAVVAIYASSSSNTVISLGLSYAVMFALALLLVERARAEARQTQTGGSVIYSANGFLAQPDKAALSAEDTTIAVIRDVSAAAAIGTGIAALILESASFGGLVYYGSSERAMGTSWVYGPAVWTAVYGLGMVIVHVAMSGSLLIMIQRQDAFTTSFVPLYAALCSQLILRFSFSRLWFAVLCAASTFVFLDDQGTVSAGSRMKVRVGKLLTLVALASFAVLTVLYARQPFQIPRLGYTRPLPLDESTVAAPAEPLGALQYTNSRVHPVDQLVRNAETSWMATLRQQSQSLEAAVAEYRRRYGIPPPPNFDKWYEFAKRKNVQLIDEYDTIYHSLLPFWALPPATVRARVREACGFGPNNLMCLLVRDGKAAHVEGGQEWLQQAAVGMMEQFVQYLPDMDLAFNVHDEPRVVVPHDELSRLVRIAVTESLPAALANPEPKNAFSSRPADVKNSKRIAEVKTTRFNVFAHQPTWLPSRLSCSPDSPARCLDDYTCGDNLTAYALGELGFVYNHTAFSDVCNSPSFATSHGFFDRPNAFNVVHDLFPIFSQSKMSSFQDILYPSPWYWYGKVSYDKARDLDWKAKINSLWWRGSTTGGFSRDGGWRRQHRQLLVKKLNALDNAQILTNNKKDDAEAVPEWTAKEVPRVDYKQAMDVHFSHVGQCDPGDCDAQREFFDIAPPVDQQDAWQYRYLLDVDGNAFSGRFYAFLKSQSLTFKMAVFREWHEEWITPWVHYIPLSLRGEEALETVRYLSAEAEGKQQAERMAQSSREWADKVLRNEDFEAWFFRLLLEYGRVVDDNREVIGYAGS